MRLKTSPTLTTCGQLSPRHGTPRERRMSRYSRRESASRLSNSDSSTRSTSTSPRCFWVTEYVCTKPLAVPRSHSDSPTGLGRLSTCGWSQRDDEDSRGQGRRHLWRFRQHRGRRGVLLCAGGCPPVPRGSKPVSARGGRGKHRARGIDIVLNAVSIQHDQGTMLDNLSPEEFLRPVTGFLLAQFLTTKAVVPHMGRVRPGVILSLSEPGARLAMPGILGHASAAAAKEAMVRVLAAELAPRLIRVIGIRPHAIADAPAAGSFTADVFAPLAARAGQDISAFLSGGPGQSTLLKRLPLLAEVAETATFLASDRSGVMTGTTVNITGGALVD